MCVSTTTGFDDHPAEPRKETVRGAGDTAQQLGAFVLVEDLDFVLGPTWPLTTTFNSGSR